MRKFLTVFLTILCFISLPTYATQIDLSALTDDNLNKQLKPIELLFNEAAKTNDLDASYNACVKGYMFKKTGDAEKIKIYNDVFSAAASEFSAQKYDLTKDRKYLKRAYKWTKISVKDKTTQIFSIKADILLASMFLDTKEMVKAYELYRAIDIQGAMEFKNKYTEIYEATRNYIAERNQQKRMAWAGALKIMGAALQTTGNAITEYEKETRPNYQYYNVNLYSF